MIDALDGSAVISSCDRYRYRLVRHIGGGAQITWIGLNPSTADAHVDDPTLRRILAFSKAWGFGTVVLVNLFAWRSTDPRALSTVPHPIGPENDTHLAAAVRASAMVLACWGARGGLQGRAAHVRKTLPKTSKCLGHTKAGHPRHPLYVRGGTAPIAL
ncbi:MAG: DUF1643 domain-containing protein [Myxococcota bacterium]